MVFNLEEGNDLLIPMQEPRKRKDLNLETIIQNPDVAFQILLKTKVIANKDRISFSKLLIKYILEGDHDRR